MSDPVTPAPSERGWGKLLLALVAFLIIPAYTPLRALLPVEDTLLLLATGARGVLSRGVVGGRTAAARRRLGRGRRMDPRATCRAGGRVLQPRARLESAARRLVRPGLPVRDRTSLLLARARRGGDGAHARAAHEQPRTAHAGAGSGRRAGGVRSPQRGDAGDVPRRAQAASRGREVDAAGGVASRRVRGTAARAGGHGGRPLSRPCCCSSRSSRSRWRGGRTIGSRARASARRSDS